jgi:nicotinic acetylcholine receptor alpha-7
MWKPADTFRISCEADVSKYPFDEQTCNFPIVPWNYLPRELTILPLADHVNMECYIPHNVWEIKYTTVWKPCVEQQDVLVFKFILKRYSGFYLLNLIFPICVLGILNLFVFLLPPESGERVGNSITFLLSIVVFLTITSNSLPSTSEFMSLLGYH